jgi:uncharacterized protein (DUF983 family)
VTAGPSPLTVGLRGLCPRCGAKGLFKGLVAFSPACRACGLDLEAFNVDDGPAALLILVVGGLITGLAIALELAASPPFWVHVILWVPLTAALVIGSLRVAKGMLVALEWSSRHPPGMAEDCRGQSSLDHRHRAREGRIAPLE